LHLIIYTADLSYAKLREDGNSYTGSYLNNLKIVLVSNWLSKNERLCRFRNWLVSDRSSSAYFLIGLFIDGSNVQYSAHCSSYNLLKVPVRKSKLM